MTDFRITELQWWAEQAVNDRELCCGVVSLRADEGGIVKVLVLELLLVGPHMLLKDHKVDSKASLFAAPLQPATCGFRGVEVRGDLGEGGNLKGGRESKPQGKALL